MARPPRPKAGTSKEAAAERRKLFVQAYLANGQNATQAAIAAGYSPNGAGVQGMRLLKDPYIAGEIAKSAAKAADDAGLSVTRLLEETAAMALGQPGEPLTYAAKTKAMEMLFKHFGLFEKDNSQTRPNLALQVVLVDSSTAEPVVRKGPLIEVATQ